MLFTVFPKKMNYLDIHLNLYRIYDKRLQNENE